MSISTQVCPEPLRQAFLDLLRYTLITIRHHSTDSQLCFAHADHMHNVPTLLARFESALLAYYWEVERRGFLNHLSSMNKQPPAAFDEYWVVVERYYRELCKQAADS